MNFAAIKKLQKLQKEMEQTQEEIANTIISETSNGIVTVDVKGTKEICGIKISPDFEIESSDDYEMLSDLIVAACNTCYNKIDKLTEEKMKKYQALLGPMGGF